MLEITKVGEEKQMQWFVYSFLVFDFWALRLYFLARYFVDR